MIPFALLVVVVALLAVVAGGILPWTVTILAAVLCAGWLLVNIRDPRIVTPVGWWAAGVTVFLALTVVPIPPFLDSMAGTPRASQNAFARAGGREAVALGVAPAADGWMSVSRNPAGTWRLLLLAIAGFAAAALSARLDSERARHYLGALVTIGAIVAVAGYVSQWVLPQGKTLWWTFPVPHGRPVGCFVNRNHFGGFLAILGPVAMVLAADRLALRRYGAAIGLAACALAIDVAAVMSASRGAWVALAAATAAAGLVLAAQRTWLRLLGMAVIVAGVALGVLRLSNEALEERFDTMKGVTTTDSAQMRMGTWADAVKIFPDYRLLGCGANGFRMVFPQYRTASTRKTFTNAENEYVQLPVELGLVGSLLVAGLLVTGVWRWRRAQGEGGERRVVDVAVLAATVAVLVHAGLDFALRVPLYFVVVCSMAGLVLGPAAPVAAPGGGRRTWLLPGCGLLVVVVSLAHGGRIYRYDADEFMETASPRVLGEMTRWSPTSWQTWYGLGRAAAGPQAGEKELGFAERCLMAATRCDPRNYRTWEALAYLRLRRGDPVGARRAYVQLTALREWKRIPELERPADPPAGREGAP